MSASSDWKKLFKDLQNAVDTTRKREQMIEIGEFAAENLRVRTRLGYGVSDNNEARSTLKPLSQKYIEQRSKSRNSKGGISEDTRPSKSNLTYTSQMLDSIQPTQVNDGKVLIEPTGTRKDGLTNQAVAGYVSEARPFFYITDLEYKKILDFIRLKLSKALASRK